MDTYTHTLTCVQCSHHTHSKRNEDTPFQSPAWLYWLLWLIFSKLTSEDFLPSLPPVIPSLERMSKIVSLRSTQAPGDPVSEEQPKPKHNKVAGIRRHAREPMAQHFQTVLIASLGLFRSWEGETKTSRWSCGLSLHSDFSFKLQVLLKIRLTIQFEELESMALIQYTYIYQVRARRLDSTDKWHNTNSVCAGWFSVNMTQARVIRVEGASVEKLPP